MQTKQITKGLASQMLDEEVATLKSVLGEGFAKRKFELATNIYRKYDLVSCHGMSWHVMSCHVTHLSLSLTLPLSVVSLACCTACRYRMLLSDGLADFLTLCAYPYIVTVLPPSKL